MIPHDFCPKCYPREALAGEKTGVKAYNQLLNVRDRLRAALIKYGAHTERCDFRYAPYDLYPAGRPCTCGLSEALNQNGRER
jgi:hypothetical protein